MNDRGLFRKAASAVLLLMTAVCVGRMHAQTFDLDYDRQPVVALHGLWHFHPGDNSAWAAPEFDDSTWPLLKSDTDWGDQGYQGLSGLAWYRFRVTVPGGSALLALYVPRLLTSYEVYADGVDVGGSGGMPPHAQGRHAIPRTFLLPAGEKSRTITIAIRVWHWPVWASYYGGGPHATTMIGVAPLIYQFAHEDVLERAWSLVDVIVLVILEGLAGIAALGFFFMRRKEREYLWFAIMLLSSASLGCYSNWAANHAVYVPFRDDFSALLACVSGLAAIAFYLRFLRGRRDWFFWVAVASTVFSLLAEFADGWLLSVKHTSEIGALLILPFSAWVLTLLVKSARAGVADARLLIFPVFLQQAAALTGGLVWLSYLTGWQHSYPLEDVPLANWPFFFTLTDAASALFLVAMLIILLGRFTRMRREEERMEAELDAARSVQHILIPENLPALPGFVLDSVYKPAGEVGGDFFQIVPLAELGCKAEHVDGGALVIVGDVSGKGLQAAMTVSLIVGSLRTLADQTARPAQILAGLNRRLYERSSGGFTTCMVMLLEGAGKITIATAGHLAPYRNGEELALESGLPLGLSLDAEYAESHFRLEPGDRLTMLSDGVLEARNAAGELFGFERTRALSTQNAQYIASAAEAFGQEDDITVLTMNRLMEATV